MTTVYAPYPFGLHPSEYGLIVMDFDTNTLLNMQGYCGVGTLSWLEPDFGPQARDINPDRSETIDALCAHNRIDGCEYSPD